MPERVLASNDHLLAFECLCRLRNRYVDSSSLLLSRFLFCSQGRAITMLLIDLKVLAHCRLAIFHGNALCGKASNKVQSMSY
jgi:hypothetical protein